MRKTTSEICKKTITAIRMPVDLKLKLTKKAKSLDRSVSWVMIDAMKKYLSA